MYIILLGSEQFEYWGAVKCIENVRLLNQWFHVFMQ